MNEAGVRLTAWERCWDAVADAVWPANNASRAYVLDVLLSVHPDPSLAVDLNPHTPTAGDRAAAPVEAGLAERVAALAEKLRARSDLEWERYQAASGVGSEALWQGRYETTRACESQVRALLGPAPAADGGAVS